MCERRGKALPKNDREHVQKKHAMSYYNSRVSKPLVRLDPKSRW